MPSCNCQFPFPKPEPFSPLPAPGRTPDWAKWIKDRLAEKGALLSFPSRSVFPVSGARPNLYHDLDTGIIYQWGGADYVVLVDPRAGDDVLVYYSVAAFREEGEPGKLYIAANDGTLYWWNGTDYAELLGDKADKVSGATEGNLAGLDSEGNLVDSTKKPADFATAAQGAKADTAVQPAAIAGFVDGAGYDAGYGDPPKPTILLKHGDEVVATVDATDFVIDGMVSGVKIENGNLVITFNTDSGKLPISIPLTDIFNPANYYDKTAADGRFVNKTASGGDTMAGRLEAPGFVNNHSATASDPVVSNSTLYGRNKINRAIGSALYAYTFPDKSGTFAMKGDATLEERGDPSTPGFSAWETGQTGEFNGETWYYPTPTYGGDGKWYMDQPVSADAECSGGPDATSLTFGDDDCGNVAVSFARTALPGYRLGPDADTNPNRDKLLASEAEVEALRQGKANKPTTSTNNNFAALDADGNLKDSGKKPADFATAEQGGKADAVASLFVGVPGATLPAIRTAGFRVPWGNTGYIEFVNGGVHFYHPAGQGSTGVDYTTEWPFKSGVFATTGDIPDVSGLASKASPATNDNFAALTASGNLKDSGKKPADFATAAQGEKANSALQGVKIGSSPVTPDGNRVVSLGTAAAKDVPASGDASSTQVVMGSDSRLPKAEDSVQRVLDNASPSAKTAVTVGVRSTENAVDRGQASLAVGDHPKASGKNAVATGTWTQATGQDAHAEGNLSQATNYGAHAEGNKTQATGAYSHAEGTDTEASGLVAHAEGNYTTAAGTGAHSEGMFAKASGVAAHAEGSNLDKLAALLEAAGADQQVVALFRSAATDAEGAFSHTEGLVSATSKMGSHAQGFRASDGGNQFSFVWQGYSGAVPTSEQMQALLNDPTSQDAQAALQCLVTALNARAAYASKGPGTFCVNPAPQGGSSDPKSGLFVGDESLDKALRYSFHTASQSTPSGHWNITEVPSGVDPSDIEIYWDSDYDDWVIFNYSTGDTAFIGRHDENDKSPISYNGYVADWVVGQSIYNLADRAINSATLGSTVTAGAVNLPAAVTGRSRDFYIDLTIEATDAPTLTFIDPATQTTAAVKFGADSLADIAPGYNLVLFTELPNNRWLVSVKHEEAAS